MIVSYFELYLSLYRPADQNAAKTLSVISKNRLLKIKTFFLILILFGCQKKEVKRIISKYPNGKEEVVKFFENKEDLENFRKEVYFENGNINYIGNFKEGKKIGKWTWYYENGKKKDECKYKDGYYVDTVYHWYENGRLKQIEIVSKEKVKIDECCNCNGQIIRYYENGKIEEIFNSKNDILEGQYVRYETNGTYKVRTYKNDILEGETTEYIIENNDTTIVKGFYKNGKEDGVWSWTHKNKTTTKKYKNGIIQQ